MDLTQMFHLARRFLTTMTLFYFATLVVLALVLPQLAKYLIITLSMTTGALVALFDRPARTIPQPR